MADQIDNLVTKIWIELIIRSKKRSNIWSKMLQMFDRRKYVEDNLRAYIDENVGNAVIESGYIQTSPTHNTDL